VTVILSLGPPGSGKTHRSLTRVFAVRKAKPLAPIWVIAPGRLSVAAYRQRLGAAGGALAVKVGTFGDLFDEILGRAGRLSPSAPDAVQRLILRQAIQRLGGDHALQHYHPLVPMPGFLDAMADAIAELDRAGVSPGVMAPAAKDHAPWLGELAAIHTAYRQALSASGWLDSESLNARACAALDGAPGLLEDVGLVVVDGFDSFEGDQLRALRALAKAVPELYLTLPGTPEMARPAHRRFARSLQRLVEAGLPLEPDSVETPVHQMGVLAKLEGALFEVDADPLTPSSRLTLIEARSPAEEAREALRWLKARIVRDKLPPGACALVTPDPARYRPLLRRAAAEFELPLRFTRGEPLATAPGIVAVLDLLSLPLLDWPQRLTLEAVHTPYLDLGRFGLDPSDRHLLEAASRYGQVVAGLEVWIDALDRLARAESLAEDQDAFESAPADAPRGEQAARLMRGLKALAERLEPPLSMESAGWVAWLEGLLDDLGFPERQATGRDRAALAALRDSLRALVLGGELAPTGEITFADFVRDLKALLEVALFDERLDWSRPPITVLRLLEARGVRYEAVAVLGLAEGVLPQVEREDPFLPDDVRRELGLEPSLGREQSGLFYQAVTRADGWLLLTRPYLAEDGETWLPSPYWHAVSSLAPEAVVRISSDAPRPLADAASSQEVLFWGVRRGGLPKHYLGSLGDRWVGLQHARDVLSARTVQVPEGVYEGDLSRLVGELGSLYGDEHVWSPSRLETYATCPHRFFVEAVLELETRDPPEPGYDAAQLGSMLHEILERAYRDADDPADPASVKQALARAAEDVFRDAPGRLGFRPTPLWDIEREDMLAMLDATAESLAEAGSEWLPLGLEASFGMEGNPPLDLETSAGTVRVRGFIDRVDRNQDGNLRIIDYKTGSAHLAASDLIDGVRLQLPLYALGAARALDMGEPVEGFYWKIRQAEPGSLKLSSFEAEVGEQPMSGPEAAYAVAREHVARILSGARTGAFPPVPPRGGCPSYCPAVAWCWRYEPSGWGG
jgi:ATP-dependent helicase/nuclease subunit B